jgi:hypothetical protein
MANAKFVIFKDKAEEVPVAARGPQWSGDRELRAVIRLPCRCEACRRGVKEHAATAEIAEE